MATNIYTENTVSEETGELVQKKWITRQATSTDHFVRLYLQDIRDLNHLTHAEHRLLVTLSTFLEYNTNQFFMNKERREELYTSIGMKASTFNVALSRLVKKNLLIKVSSFTYQMNPKIFFNGEELQRSKILEVVYRYTICPDC